MRKVTLMQTQENKRKSNIELFRILSMLTIVAHHYVVNSGLMSCIDSQNTLHLDNVGSYYEKNIAIHAVLSVIVVCFVCVAIDMLRIRFVEKPLFARERINKHEVKL